MRFVHLSVESFRAIRTAEIGFGPGLNVLYGPNDLGKSTLATAIQAALLVAPGSAEATGYSPWHAGATPRVKLTFVDDDGRYWRVKKAFGDEQTAELYASKDGITFSIECKGREVEEKVRALLAWGLPVPGGKGGHKGLPTTFLSNALLAPQTQVDAILAQSLATDSVTTGKLRLSRALATLAQDPLFKKVLDAAQAEVRTSFTPKGKFKRGAGSPFVQASDAVKQLQEELATLENQRSTSKTVEAEVNSQRVRYAQGLSDVLEAKTQHAVVQAALEAARARQAVQLRVDEALAEVGRINAQAGRVAVLEAQADGIWRQVKELTDRVKLAQYVRDEADTNLREAEEAHRVATSADGARERELQEARLQAQAAKLREQLRASETHKAKVVAAIAAADVAEKARDAARNAAAEATEAAGALEVVQQQLAEAVTDLEFARALHAYGRWRAAVGSSDESNKARQSAFERRKDAAAAEAMAGGLETEHRTKQTQLESRGSVLPGAEQLEALRMLEQELALAEAALEGAGVSVAIRSRGQTAVRAVVDGRAKGAGEELPAEVLLEAQRSVKLTVGDTLEIDVTAGSPEKLGAVARLRERWATEGAPVLTRAGAGSTAELVQAVAAHTAEWQALAASAKELERLRGEVKNLSEQAARDEEQAERLATAPEELARLRALIGSSEEPPLAEALNKYGKGWESQAEALQATTAKKVELLKEQAKTSAQLDSLALYKTEQADKLAGSQAETAASLTKDLGGGEPHKLLRTVETECATLARQELDLQTALEAITKGTDGEVARAQQAVEDARTRMNAADVALEGLGKDLDAASAAFHSRTGECAQAKVQLAEFDRAGAEAMLAKRKLELAALPAATEVSEAVLTQSATRVADTERALDHIKQELHTSEGALSKVGGAALDEEALRLQEALEVAEQREKDLEVDASAWKLLHETLRSVENEEGAHLGRALGQPLSKKFTELTGGRYEGVRIDAALKTEGLAVVGVNVEHDDVLEALSVGTRDQLATLIRLTIAEQLKTAIVLDDHLVHTDPARQKWFVEAFLKTALESQVVVLTCKPEGYLDPGDLSDSLPASRDVAGGRIRVVDVGRVLQRWGTTLG